MSEVVWRKLNADLARRTMVDSEIRCSRTNTAYRDDLLQDAGLYGASGAQPMHPYASAFVKAGCAPMEPKVLFESRMNNDRLRTQPHDKGGNMRSSLTMRVICIGVLTFVVTASRHVGQGSGTFVIRDVRVFDGEQVLEHQNVVVQDGTITRLTQRKVNKPGAQVIEGAGDTLLPGLFDSHVHVAEDIDGSLRQALVFGVTTEIDMFNAGERLKRLKKAEVADAVGTASLRTAGVGATAPGGHPSQMGGPPFPTLTKPEQAQPFVDARIAEGSDFIKIIYDDNAEFGENKRLPALDKATIKAVIDAAHKRHKLVVVHVVTEQQARDAIDAGADGLAHLLIGDTVSNDFGRFVGSHHVFVIPTLSTLHMICGKSPGPSILADPHLEPHIEAQWRSMLQVPPNSKQNHLCNATDDAMHQLIAARVPILAGTDSPVPGNVYGASVHIELELLVQSGLTPLQALAAATSLPAKIFGVDDRGSIQQGRRADLLLVEGNPTEDIRATQRIVAVWKRGSHVQR